MLSLVAEKPKGDPLLMAAEKAALAKASKPTRVAFSLAVLAGIYIGIAFTFYITVVTGAGDMPWGISRLLGGLVFSLGLILVVVGGAELFTSTVLTVVPWASGRLSGTRMLAHWGRIYAGNIVGALSLVALLLMAGQPDLLGGQWGLKVMSVASHKLEHTFAQAVALGALCNLLVCLGVWMTFATDNTAAKAALVILPVAMFVSAGFEHSIANLFLVPLGIAIFQLADAGFWSAVGADPAQFAHLTVGNFIVHNLIPVTLGNVLGGGLFVGLFHWWIHGQRDPIETNSTALQGVPTMTKPLSQMTAADLADTQPLLVAPEANVAEVTAQLMARGRGAALVVKAGEPIGLVDEQDLLQACYLANFEDTQFVPVEQAMQPVTFIVDADERITKLACRMAVDEAKMYPVNDGGYLTSYNIGSLEQRAKDATPAGNAIAVVMQEGRVIGVVEKRKLLALVTGTLVEQKEQDESSEKEVA
ncbi:formate transporter FocA [Ferrimonas balearica]|uniref:formate transporter FocA n=1 Tax=Ferrimonas balearica TaxID=44012 RepID=UPI001F2B6CF5|nr:formate transporter FocA [Ferrimonas balearica]MBY6093310.1 formate transporter FocA [Ferrimonas balearica]